MKVVKLPNGGFNQTTQMLKGRFHICPEERSPHASRADKVWHLQSQRLVNLPMQIGRVPSSVMKAIQAEEVDKAGAATGKATEPPPPANTPENAKPEEEAPSDDSLNEVDDDRHIRKGLDDNGSKETLALEKAGLIDLGDENNLEKLMKVRLLKKPLKNLIRKRMVRTKKAKLRLKTDLVSNFDDVIDVTKEAESLGARVMLPWIAY